LIEEIVRLKENGFTLKQIADQMDLSIGKVQYRLKKYHLTQNSRRKITKPSKVMEPIMEPIMEPNDTKRYEIPSQYNEDSMTAIIHSPNCFYLYWSLSNTKQQMVEHHLRSEWSNLPKIVKVYDISDMHFQGHNHHKSIEFPIPEVTNNWFVRDVDPNRTYIADFGTKTFDGSFFTILRSNPIETPRSSNQFYTPRHSNSVYKWKEGTSVTPEWLEQVSSYSFYGTIK
jgi:hypothetical protein